MESRLGKSFNETDIFDNYNSRNAYANDLSAHEIKLNVSKKRNSSGIRDDESILCPTPPE
jgi:hypothetical protein